MIMIIKTKYNVGESIIYDTNKHGVIVGYEISDTRGVNYKIKADNITDQVDLINYGCLRVESEIKSSLNLQSLHWKNVLTI